MNYKKAFKKNYHGFAFSLDKGYNKEYRKSKDGKKELKKSRKRMKKLQDEIDKNGFDNSETWNLNGTIAQFIYPRIKVFAKDPVGYPPSLTPKSWEKILKKMVYSFKMLSKDVDSWGDYEKVNDKVNIGLDLFSKYYSNLWS